MTDEVVKEKEVIIEGIHNHGFGNDGNSIFLYIKPKPKTKSVVKGVMVDIYSYADSKLQTEQLEELGGRKFASVYNFTTRKMVQLEDENTRIIASLNRLITDKYVLVACGDRNAATEWHWNKYAQASVYVVSTESGNRKLILDSIAGGLTSVYNFRLSPRGRFVLYYHCDHENYYAYDNVTDKSAIVTGSVSTKWTTYIDRDIRRAKYMPIPLPGFCWIDESTALIRGQYDLFQVDLIGRKKPINLTNGYGYRNNVVFDLAFTEWQNHKIKGAKILLNAFDRGTKNNGFFLSELGKQSEPVLLTMQPFIFSGTSESDWFSLFQPVKAKDANVFVVRKMSACESPNLFWTSDFRNFKQISNIYPERKFNWLYTELITFQTEKGINTQGILYKPENFDSSKKYPIIFFYYERLSEGLNGFIQPDITHGPINIPYFVSNEYLVFVPDMIYKVGYPGESALDIVESAAKLLAKKSWVDSRRMGIQGHSRGGYQTLFIVTHSNLFAAAMAASGMSDYVSLYGNVKRGGVDRMHTFEQLYQRIGCTLWERPDLFILNSPIFNVHNVKTPILMMNNKEDGDIPFTQGLEFFLGLRRMGKKAWMLQYDGQAHSAFNEAGKDLTVRTKQFFDHYLKGIPPPKWMTRGIRAAVKGIDDGFELDYEINTPLENILLRDVKDKIDKLQLREPIIIKLK